MVSFHPPTIQPPCMLHRLFHRRHLITSRSHTLRTHHGTHVMSTFTCAAACFDDVLLLSLRIIIGVFHFPLFSRLWSVLLLFVFLRPFSSSHSLFSFSTPEFRSPSHGGNLNRSASLSCTERTPECGSVGGSVTQIPGTPFQYVPDFCVRALTDLQFVKVTYLVPGSRPRRIVRLKEALGGRK